MGFDSSGRGRGLRRMVLGGILAASMLSLGPLAFRAGLFDEGTLPCARLGGCPHRRPPVVLESDRNVAGTVDRLLDLFLEPPPGPSRASGVDGDVGLSFGG